MQLPQVVIMMMAVQLSRLSSGRTTQSGLGSLGLGICAEVCAFAA